LLTEDDKVKVLNHETGKVTSTSFAEVTAVRWHPRVANKILIGFQSGNIQLFDTTQNKTEQYYRRPV